MGLNHARIAVLAFDPPSCPLGQDQGKDAKSGILGTARAILALIKTPNFTRSKPPTQETPMKLQEIGIILDALTWTHAAISRVEGTTSQYRVLAPSTTIDKLSNAIPVARRLAEQARNRARSRAERLAIAG